MDASADMMNVNLGQARGGLFSLEGQKLITRASRKLQVFMTDNTRAGLQTDGHLQCAAARWQTSWPAVRRAPLLEKLASSLSAPSTCNRPWPELRFLSEVCLGRGLGIQPDHPEVDIQMVVAGFSTLQLRHCLVSANVVIQIARRSKHAQTQQA